MKLKIKKNVGLALVKQKRFGKGIEVYEDIMNDQPDFDVGFNLIVCLYSLGEREKMRTWFERLLLIDILNLQINYILKKFPESKKKNSRNYLNLINKYC